MSFVKDVRRAHLTLAIAAVLVIVFIIQLMMQAISGIDLSSCEKYALWPRRNIDEARTGQITFEGVFSLFFSNFLHLNPFTSDSPIAFFHLIINTAALVQDGMYLEQEFGKMSFLMMNLFFILLVGPLEIPLALFLELITRNKWEMFSTNYGAVGFSGVIFGYIMVYLKAIPGDKALFCGVPMNKWIIPVVWLLALTFMLGACFCGHLSGILLGILYAFVMVPRLQRKKEDEIDANVEITV